MRVATLVAALLLMAACDEGDESPELEFGTATGPPTAVTTTTSVATTAASAITPSTTTATAADPPTTTTAPTTTIATSTTATSTTTPPSTEAQPDTPEEQVEADYIAAKDARQRCAYDPPNCDYAAIAVPGSPMDRSTRELMAQRIEANLRAVEGHGDVQLRVEAVEVVGASAFVTICAYDTIVIFDVADPANPHDDIVFNEEVGSFRVKWELRQVNGRWLLYEGVGIAEVRGADLCGF